MLARLLSLPLAALALACASPEPVPASAPLGPAPAEPAAPAPSPESAPPTSGGDPGFDHDVSGVVGAPPPAWDVGPWYNSPPLTPADLRGKVVLVRWFMSPNCPLCSATAPALKALDERYRSRGLVVVGMYHHKDDEPLDPAAVKGYLSHFGYSFPVAIDPDWRTLKRWWIDGHPKRQYTSVSFLLDRAGLVRHVHLGGQLAPGTPEFATVEERVRALLDEPAR
ncbi:redoxin family protein [Sorangium sp. So ce185]|uniref:TlpA family protein disulfide reductase n=1 Tax=Sorangium sp. So ce185 TaxID=3133287 RepID=UPI003F5D65B1